MFGGLLIGLSGLSLIGGALTYHRTGSLMALLAGCGIALGAIHGGYQASEALRARLPVCIDREFHELRIRVVSEPIYQPAGKSRSASARFDALLMEPIASAHCAADSGARVALNWYEPPQLGRGEVWTVDLRLRPPWGYQNPGGFDYERWLYAKRYQGTGYVRRGERISRGLETSPVAGFSRFLESTAVANAALLRALALGDGSAITPEQWELFRRTGTVHLMVVSGLHVGLVTGAGYWLLSLLLRFLPQIVSPVRLAAVLALSGAGIFVWSTGSGVPALRAWLMSAVVMVSLLLGRRISRGAVFVFAMALILLLEPLVVHDNGFYLSFAAVGALLWVWSSSPTQLRLPLALVFTQLVLFAALTPMLSLQQAQVPGVSSMSNLVAVPLLSLILPVTLSAALIWSSAPALADFLVGIADCLLELLLIVLEWFGQAPLFNAGSGSLLPSLLSLLAAWLLLGRLRGAWGWLVLASWLVWLAPEQLHIPVGSFQVTALDVGQGSAISIDTAAHRLLFDTGPGYPGGFNLGDAAVVPTLLRTGNARIDALVLSHADRDHTGGLAAVVGAISIDRIYASFSAVSVAQSGSELSSIRCREGLSWVWDDVHFEFENPEPAAGASDNDRSCVLRVSSKLRSARFAGDISTAVEGDMVRAGLRPVDLLMAPHHGSRSSSSARWIRAGRPHWVIVSAPRRSRYGHPHPEVVNRYLDAGARVVITGYAGAVVWRSWRPERLERWRQRRRAYWLNPPVEWPARAHPDDGSSLATD